MIKELGTYKVNNKDAVFTASLEKKSFQTIPVAIFSFADGSYIQIRYLPLSKTYDYSSDMTPKVVYNNGVWSFV